MGYNWEKIFKSKKDKELYEIFIGKQNLNEEAKEFAKKELVARGIQIDNIENYQKKWLLSDLIDEERRGSGLFRSLFSSFNSKSYLISSILGFAVTFVFILDYFFQFLDLYDERIDMYEWMFPLFAFVFSLVQFFTYRKRKKREMYRKDKIKQLIKEI